MNQEIRVKRLLNKVKKQYSIKGKIDLRFMKKEVTLVSADKKKVIPFMYLEYYSDKSCRICVCPQNSVYRFEKIEDKRIERSLAHEITHLLISQHSKEKDPKKLRNILNLIDRIIDHGYYEYYTKKIFGSVKQKSRQKGRKV